MAAFAAGIFSHVTAAAQTLSSPTTNASPKPEASPLNSTSSTGTSSAGISANDFLTLLVTEMKNQDPTANTDPNEYINQLVNVNSLEQLIDINQNLTAALNQGSNARVTEAIQMPASAEPHSTMKSQSAAATIAPQASAASSVGSGNLTLPRTAPAAQSLAHALSGTPHAKSTAIGLR